MAWPDDGNYEPLSFMNQGTDNLLDISKFGQDYSVLDTNNLFTDKLKKPAGFMDGFGLSDAIGAGTDILGGYLNYSALQAGKKQNKQANALSLANLANQAKTTNASLHDRQQARVAMDPNAMGVADYMEKFGVSGTV